MPAGIKVQSFLGLLKSIMRRKEFR